MNEYLLDTSIQMNCYNSIYYKQCMANNQINK